MPFFHCNCIFLIFFICTDLQKKKVLIILLLAFCPLILMKLTVTNRLCNHSAYKRDDAFKKAHCVRFIFTDQHKWKH